MKMLTKPDILWLRSLMNLIKYLNQEYPELFSEEDEEALKIADQLIEELDEDIND